MLTLASTLIMAACSKDDIEQPTPEDTNINLKTLADFKANMNTVNDDKKTYKAFVSQDIATDSLGLATTLTDWKKMNDSKNNLTTNWGNKGIYVEKNKMVYALADYIAAGKPAIKPNPDNGLMPYAHSESDSIAYDKMGIKLKVRRTEKGVIEIEDATMLQEALEKIENTSAPIILDVTGELNIGNDDTEILEKILDKIISDPDVTKQGDIAVSANSDSVAVSSDFINKIKTVDGKIVANGSNALFLKDIGDVETLRSVIQASAKIRTEVSENFANTDVAIPNRIVYRNVGTKSRSADATVDFSAGIKSLPVRDKTWKTNKYILDTGESEIVVKDETVLGRISQPSVRGTAQYPNPDIYTEQDPVYTSIFLDNTKVYSDSTNLAINQRVRGSKGRARVRTTATSSANSWALEHYSEEKNLVTMSPDGSALKECILLTVSDYRLSLNYPVLAEHADMQVFPYSIDAMNYCFVAPASDCPAPSDVPEVQIENDRKVLKMIEGYGIISIQNRVVNEGGVGKLPQRKSFFWISPAEYADYVARGKQAR